MRSYSMTMSASVSAAQDLFELKPTANRPIRLLGVFLSQYSDTGDSEEEILRIKFVRGHTTSGSGGSAVTPVPMDSNDTSAVTGSVNNTTTGSAGTGVDIFSHAFNIRTGMEMWFTPETAPRVQNPELLHIRLMGAPNDALSMVGTIFFAEE